MVIAPADVPFKIEIALPPTTMLPVFVPDPSTKILWPLSRLTGSVVGVVMRMSAAIGLPSIAANAFGPLRASRAAVTAVTKVFLLPAPLP